ncbi:MAG TPA: hypothetical protein VLE97_06050 [Gaiellaceae bacterium]|nr:hypothetical protein [Gaiellaceae bacterium]
MIACPTCGSKTRVLETRGTGSSTRRRRGCVASKCSGKTTTVEIVVPDGQALAFGSGALVVSARQLAKLRTRVSEIESGALAAALVERHLVKPTVVAKSLSTVAKQIAALRQHIAALQEGAL